MDAMNGWRVLFFVGLPHVAGYITDAALPPSVSHLGQGWGRIGNEAAARSFLVLMVEVFGGPHRTVLRFGSTDGANGSVGRRWITCLDTS